MHSGGIACFSLLAMQPFALAQADDPLLTHALSHNSKDKARVHRLAERLRAAGLRGWFDEWVIQPGDDIYLAIERGLEASRTLLLCLLPAAIASDWVGLERSTVLFRHPSNAGGRFIPMQLDDAPSKVPCRNSSISTDARRACCDGAHLTDSTPLQADKLHASQ